MSSTSVVFPVALSVSGAWTLEVTTSGGQTSNSFPFQVTAAPQKPGAFQLSADTPACNGSMAFLVGISWSAANQAASYNIYRNSYLAATVQSSTLAWVDPGTLGAGKSYSYFVIASNAQGATQSNSNRGPNWILSQTFTKVKLPGIPALKAARACLPASGTDFGHDVIHFATHPFLGNANRHGGLKCQYHRCAFLA